MDGRGPPVAFPGDAFAGVRHPVQTAAWRDASARPGLTRRSIFLVHSPWGPWRDRRKIAHLFPCGRRPPAGSPSTTGHPRTGGLCREDYHAPPVPWSPHSRNPCAPATQHKRRERGGSNPFRRRSLLERSVHRWQIFRSAADTYGRSETQN
jgi:hypothetical protein